MSSLSRVVSPAFRPIERRRPIAYVLYAFPQLSETFIENELAALRGIDVEVRAWSLYRPPAGLEGATSLDPRHLAYAPSWWRLGAHWMRWAVIRPVPTS